ncbi:MAG: hypothetical protein HQM03_05865 [Magnetococcales bacterium]|nr:hypothetical protein [Magnetococcales bacterium]
MIYTGFLNININLNFHIAANQNTKGSDIATSDPQLNTHLQNTSKQNIASDSMSRKDPVTLQSVPNDKVLPYTSPEPHNGEKIDSPSESLNRKDLVTLQSGPGNNVTPYASPESHKREKIDSPSESLNRKDIVTFQSNPGVKVAPYPSPGLYNREKTDSPSESLNRKDTVTRQSGPGKDNTSYLSQELTYQPINHNEKGIKPPNLLNLKTNNKVQFDYLSNSKNTNNQNNVSKETGIKNITVEKKTIEEEGANSIIVIEKSRRVYTINGERNTSPESERIISIIKKQDQLSSYQPTKINKMIEAYNKRR